MSIPKIRDWRETAKVVLARYASQITDPATPNNWSTTTNDFNNRLAEGINESYTSNGYSTLQFNLMGEATRFREQTLKLKAENPLESKLMTAYIYAISRHIEAVRNAYGMSLDLEDSTLRVNTMSKLGDSIDANPIDEHPTHILLTAMIECVITKDDISKALAKHAELMRVWSSLQKSTQPASSGFTAIMEKRPNPDKNVIIQQADEYKKLITNNLTARTWGFEIEVPDAKDVNAPSGIEKGDDGSLRSYESSDNCECDCDSCYYHECDCEHCETGSSDPEHDCGSNACSQADSAEYRSIGGIQRMKHNGMNELCKKLNDENAEKNDSAGTHIHVYGRDLNAAQIGQVMAIYQWNYEILSVIAGRKNVNYAKDIPNEYITRLLKKNGPKVTCDKPVAVNLTPLILSTRGTIEFRQMDCNLDAELITLWAWIVRGIVSIAKRGAHFSDFKNVTDLKGIITVFDKFAHTLYSEFPDDIVYGSKTDADRIVAPELVQFGR